MGLITVSQANLSEVQPTILSSLYAAQTEVADSLGIDPEIMFLQQYCGTVTPKAIKNLAKAGFYAVAEVREGWSCLYHTYVRFPGLGNPDQEIIADGTWGQFIPSELVYLGEPKVLLGNRNGVITAALKYGVPTPFMAYELWGAKK